MGASLSPFCEHCGAANEPQAISCCFCGQSIQDMPGTLATSSTGNLPIDTMLKGRYRIVAPLGRGGMSTVYRAQDTELNNRPVVVKEMRLSGLGGKDAQDAAKAFKREATILASLQHANLPSIFEHFEEQGHWYLVMSFIQGEALDDYLNRSKAGKLPLHEVLHIGQQLCAVLHYLHSQQPPIIFRDVKPANIIRTPDGQIYLIDFGVARRFKPGQKKDTTPFGSMGYAPPEQFGKSQTTPRSDIYSLGATLHQLLSGHEPESKASHFPSLSSLEPTVPTPLADLIAQMLSADESKRPANMQIVAQHLKEIGKVAPAFPSFTLPQKSAPKKLSRLQFAMRVAILAICCLLIGGLGGGLIGVQNITATHQAHADATAAALNVTATAVQNILFADPYPPQGKLVLMDSLKQANTWQEGSDSDWGGQCQFKNGGFEVSQIKGYRTYICQESKTYKNFAIQVQMTITQGDCGGIDFRENEDNSQSYHFEVCINGTYHLYHYTSNSNSTTLSVNNTSKAIQTGFATNTMAVVANGSNFDLYVNNQKLESISDSSYPAGLISLTAISEFNHPTTILFHDVRIWELP